MQPVTNEVGRWLVRLPPGTNFYSRDSTLAITVDKAPDGQLRYAFMDDSRARNIDMDVGFWSWSSTLCSGRARDTVRGRVVVAGKRIEPERYLKLWRDAEALQTTPDQFIHATGLGIVLDVRIHLPTDKDGRTGWTDAPLKNVGEYLAHYGDRIVREGDYATITLDLCEPEAARLAFYLQGMFTTRKVEQPDGSTDWVKDSSIAGRLVPVAELLALHPCERTEAQAASQPLPIEQVELFELV